MMLLSSLTAARKRLILAVCCGVAAALLIGVYTGDLKAQAAFSRNAAIGEYGGDQVEVLVAARDIAVGETLSADNATLQLWLADLLPTGTFTTPEAAYGQSVCVPVYKNEPIMEAKIATSGQKLEVPEGLCALSVPVSDEMAIGGALVAGSAVDVYAIGESVVSLVASDVLVLEASNGYGDEGSAGFFSSSSRATLKWATLAVQPAMVSELLAASRDKNLSLVLPGENASSVAPVPTPDAGADTAQWANDVPGSNLTENTRDRSATPEPSDVIAGSDLAETGAYDSVPTHDKQDG
ncbi:MAG: Flp pilus assembly protein CpaB [Coriobacteriales bacterium]|nr:Flp pilus assembly protein CpaB [Coriobacteriales bacterium]